MEPPFERPKIASGQNPEFSEPSEWKWLTNIGIEHQEQQRSFYEAQGKEVRFGQVRDREGKPVDGTVALEVREKKYRDIPESIKLFLESLQHIDPTSEIGIESFEDVGAKFYRGTILGLVMAAIAKEHGNLRSFSPDRVGFEPMETTVVSDLRSVAENYAKIHGPGKPVTEHDIRGVASALDIDPRMIREQYQFLFLPVVLHFRQVVPSGNPQWMHEYQTSTPLNLFRDLTEASREHLEKIFGRTLEEVQAFFNQECTAKDENEL